METSCISLEPFALQVLDDAMAPEVPAGSIVVVDPGEPARDGSVVLLERDGEVRLRRLRFDAAPGAGDARSVPSAGTESALEGEWRRALRGVVTAVRVPRKSAPPTAYPSPDRPPRPVAGTHRRTGGPVSGKIGAVARPGPRDG